MTEAEERVLFDRLAAALDRRHGPLGRPVSLEVIVVAALAFAALLAVLALTVQAWRCR